MNKKQFTFCGLIIMFSILTVFAWSITSGNVLLPIIAIILGISGLYVCKRRMEIIVADERDYQIAEKASRSSLQFFIIINASIGVMLTVLSRSGYPELAPIGLTLTYSATTLLLLYTVFYSYYRRKYGG